MTWKSKQFVISLFILICSQWNMVAHLMDAQTWFGVTSLIVSCWFAREYIKRPKK